MDDEVKKVCVIVGAGSGVSMGLARLFGYNGYAVGLIARRADKLAELARELQEAGTEALGFPADASDPAELENAFRHVEEQFGSITVLVYNAAKLQAAAPSELPAADFVDDFRVNVVGALVSAQLVIPSMKTSGGGSILFTGGGLALRPMPQYASLAASKAALRNLTFSLAGELAEHNIHVATVTIAGFVQPGTFFDPDKIAETYWALHQQEKEVWETEVIYREES